ncbi:MAG: hypothetical protein A4E45_01433 [Methanosaeta sp. PtaB.Bin039]|nr:MAG: hypothetical protein A4E45_01433 [Methanosaeta sp. PtaB.Bin039]OPY46037.1 MAG: hypothetical protein A4E47_00739 [Methanosaeta sp. PtaU1.Bin028]HOT06599.1 hypothetical protein [Methanotrichaceae archaeon]HQF16519.1 hypothetical protein [Methanotrichaceae archaeon]HQI91110.1 hypothetical protein [Methanotrichaceae archaeon]
MRTITTLIIISMLMAGLVASAGAAGVIDLSSLGKKPVIEPISLPRMTSYTPSFLSYENANPTYNVIDLSTLNRKAVTPSVAAYVIKGANPIKFTPTVAIFNQNRTASLTNTVVTPSFAVAANRTAITPPQAIFGGA